MKNLKKLIAVVLTFTLVFSAMAVGFAGTFSDVSSSAPYASAVARLQSLGLVSGMPDGTFQPDGVVTRAQMIAFVNAAEGLQQAAKVSAGPTKFSDVPANFWAAGDINVADPSGYPDGTFRPNNPVTYTEALAMILRALGYTQDYSWPYGVISKATSVGITKGVVLSAGTTITRGEMAMLINNALDLDINTYVNGAESDTGKTLLSRVGNSTTYYVYATHDVDSSVTTGYVKVVPVTETNGLYQMTYNNGNLVYTLIPTGSVNFNNYLGQIVTVNEDTNGNPLAATPVTTDIKTFTATTNSEVSFNATTQKYSFYDASVSVDNIPVVVDGVLTTMADVYKSQVVDNGSKITLIDPTNVSGYGYAVITDATGNAQSLLVNNNVTSSSSYIDNRFAINDSNGNPYPVVGAVSKATDIKAGDVVYQVSIPVDNQDVTNGTATVLYVVRQSVTGTISQVSVSGSTTTVTINGTNYTVGSAIPGSTGVSVSAGSTGTAIVGKNNTIVQWSGTSTATNYAVVQYGNTFTPYNTSVSLALPDGTSKVFNVVYSDIPSTVVANVYAGDVVTYSLDSNGNISNLAEITVNSVPSTGVLTDKTDNLIKINGTPYYVSSSTVFYNYDPTDKTLTPVNWSDVADSSHPAIYAYSLSSSSYGTLSLVIFNNVASLTSTTTPVDYVTGINEVVTSSTSYISLNVIENGVSKTYNAPAGTLNLGDIAVNSNGTIATGATNAAYQLTINASGNVIGATLLSKADTTAKTVYAEGTTVYFNYQNNSIYTSAGFMPLDNNVVVINAVNGANTVVGLGSIVQDTVTKDANGNITGLNGVTGSSVVDVYTNPSTGKAVLIIIRGTK
ncbi:S-layer homology domain-containing protein [Thermoanaerobacterium aotearoense]|uniref:S-layer protein n=1 Tax=Thermoanaerobacterium aotearoense SCUT27 TaxID=1421016 RepID=W9EE14_9THEO|nr:S-layer homology domain-containing protein [Thermoanaerobacterium aotearoense]ETO39456.1 S-layer protein [Thermoanaerobacterium aotearoense SCUT27]